MASAAATTPTRPRRRRLSTNQIRRDARRRSPSSQRLGWRARAAGRRAPPGRSPRCAPTLRRAWRSPPPPNPPASRAPTRSERGARAQTRRTRQPSRRVPVSLCVSTRRRRLGSRRVGPRRRIFRHSSSRPSRRWVGRTPAPLCCPPPRRRARRAQRSKALRPLPWALVSSTSRLPSTSSSVRFPAGTPSASSARGTRLSRNNPSPGQAPAGWSTRDAPEKSRARASARAKTRTRAVQTPSAKRRRRGATTRSPPPPPRARRRSFCASRRDERARRLASPPRRATRASLRDARAREALSPRAATRACARCLWG
mmetsp:Transcript_6429/g.27376  ORF Transcript_6429/g.27376 Transcript_6429/m.27376 type:complete len:313 (-) Transcript_6429:250-1188(-)